MALVNPAMCSTTGCAGAQLWQGIWGCLALGERDGDRYPPRQCYASAAFVPSLEASHRHHILELPAFACTTWATHEQCHLCTPATGIMQASHKQCPHRHHTGIISAVPSHRHHTCIV
eukprot:976681-Pelagomonas_calceolata.AAC.1